MLCSIGGTIWHSEAVAVSRESITYDALIWGKKITIQKLPGFLSHMLSMCDFIIQHPIKMYKLYFNTLHLLKEIVICLQYSTNIICTTILKLLFEVWFKIMYALENILANMFFFGYNTIFLQMLIIWFFSYHSCQHTIYTSHIHWKFLTIKTLIMLIL